MTKEETKMFFYVIIFVTKDLNWEIVTKIKNLKDGIRIKNFNIIGVHLNIQVLNTGGWCQGHKR